MTSSLLQIKDDECTRVTIYRKLTHTDHNPHFDSKHHLGYKRAEKTLFHPANTVISKEEDTDRTPENEYLEGVVWGQ